MELSQADVVLAWSFSLTPLMSGETEISGFPRFRVAFFGRVFVRHPRCLGRRRTPGVQTCLGQRCDKLDYKTDEMSGNVRK